MSSWQEVFAATRRASLEIVERPMLCPWQHIALVLRQRPPSQDVARRLVASGAVGVRVPSAGHLGGITLVLWRRNDAADRLVFLASLNPRQAMPEWAILPYLPQSLCRTSRTSAAP